MQQEKCSFLIETDPVFRKGLDLYVYQLLNSTKCVKKQLKIELGVPFLTFNGNVLEEDLVGRMTGSVIQLISSNWSYKNWTEGADQFFIKTMLYPRKMPGIVIIVQLKYVITSVTILSLWCMVVRKIFGHLHNFVWIEKLIRRTVVQFVSVKHFKS